MGHNIIPRGQKPLKKHPNATDNSTEFLQMSKALQKAAKNLFFLNSIIFRSCKMTHKKTTEKLPISGDISIWRQLCVKQPLWEEAFNTELEDSVQPCFHILRKTYALHHTYSAGPKVFKKYCKVP